MAQYAEQGGGRVSPQAFIQQRIHHVYQWQRPTLLPSPTAKSRHRSQLGVDGLQVAHARSLGPRVGVTTSPIAAA
jgi:hypothetical protein